MLNLPLIVHAILEDCALPWHGDHGVGHWARILENGLRLAAMTGANLEVVQLFAVFHDSKRVNECSDPDHGRFAAQFAAELRGHVFDLSDHEFGLLHRAQGYSSLLDEAWHLGCLFAPAYRFKS